MTTGTKATFQRAIDKAEQLRPQVTDLGDGRYAVQGSTKLYTVTVDSQGEYACTCQAGERGQACYHQGGTWLKRLSQRAFGITPGSPAPAAVPAHMTATPASRDGIGVGIGGARWSEADDDQSDYRAIYAPQRVAA